MGEFRVFSASKSFSTRGSLEFVDLSSWVKEIVAESGVREGLVHVFAPHATGVLLLTEDEPGLFADVKAFFERLVPRDLDYEHPSNAFAHLRSILFPPDRTLPIIDGRVGFGTWQSLFFVETDVSPRRRIVIFQVLGQT